MRSAVRASLALLLLFSSAAPGGEIYRHRTADGRTIFTDNAARPEDAVESSKVSGAGNRAVAPAPGAARTAGTQGEVRAAEAELLQAYHRLTAGVKPREDEILPAEDPTPPARGKRREIPKTPEYYQRIDLLKADIARAQERLDAARARLHASAAPR